MASKGPRINVMLLSTGKTQKGKDTGFSYTTSVNPRNQANKGNQKLELMKLDPRAYNEETGRPGKKVLFKQKKIPK